MFRPDSGRADIKAWQKKVKETNGYVFTREILDYSVLSSYALGMSSSTIVLPSSVVLPNTVSVCSAVFSVSVCGAVSVF